MQSILIIAGAYILCHGITALLVTPVQHLFASHATVFASLLYLPHGVRVLAAWFLGWRAFPALVVGAVASEVLFTPAEVFSTLQPVMLASITVGAMSAPLAFSLAGAFGRNLHAGEGGLPDWKWLLAIGALASVLNSVGQSLVFSGFILPESFVTVAAIYAIGDMTGLFACMWALMLIFRWIRLSSTGS